MEARQGDQHAPSLERTPALPSLGHALLLSFLLNSKGLHRLAARGAVSRGRDSPLAFVTSFLSPP